MRRKLTELLAMTMIGDGVLAMTAPDRHLRLWEGGPRPLDTAIRAFRRHPRTTRALGGIEAAAGIWLAFKLYR